MCYSKIWNAFYALRNAYLTFTIRRYISSSDAFYAPTEGDFDFMEASYGPLNETIWYTAFVGWKSTPWKRNLHICRFFSFVTYVWRPIRSIPKTHLQNAKLEGCIMRRVLVEYALANAVSCFVLNFEEFYKCLKLHQQIHRVERYIHNGDHQIFVFVSTHITKFEIGSLRSQNRTFKFKSLNV